MLPENLDGMAALAMEIAPSFTFTMGHERGIGWDSESLEITASPPCRVSPPGSALLSLWRLGGRWRFCLRPGAGGGRTQRGPLVDRAELARLLAGLVRS